MREKLLLPAIETAADPAPEPEEKPKHKPPKKSPAANAPATAPQTPPPEKAPHDPSHFGALIQKVAGRQASAEEVAELYRLQEALRLRDNDALWLVMALLEHYRSRIETAVNESLAGADKAAAAIMDAAKARFIAQLPAEMAKTAQRVTVKSLGYSGPVVVSGLLGAVLLMIAGMGISAWVAHGWGESTGYKQCLIDQKPPANRATGAAPVKKP